MRRTRGQTTFSGTVAYLPQTPWIMNATLRENILFGYDYDANRYQEVITACQLGPDIAILPHGDGTEIGEKGISLSGGTKARVSLARAAYSYCDAVILDDTLSAVDAHVGKAILEECLLTGPLSNRTRILVTHALHVLPHVDMVFVVDEGKITEQGPYKELLTHGGAFSRLIEEFGNERQETVDKETGEASPKKQVGDTAVEKDIKENKGIMQEEERNTGAVKGEIYKKYLVAAGGISWAPVFLFLLVVNEAANVATNLFLGFWTSRKISQFENKDYMGVYAGLGAGNAFATFCAAYCFCIAGLRASYHLHSKAFQSVLKSPTSFFDTSPTGRIVARFSRDTEVLDSELALGFFSLTLTFFSIFGIAGLIFYTFPYLGILFLPLGILYYITALYYRRTSVETKRLDSLLRSTLFAVYSEALSGLATLRASRREAAFTQTVEQAVDHQNRAHIINVILRSWLGVRLDAFGNLLILGIALFAVGLRKDVDPSKVGVVLSYSLAITWNFSELVNQYATLEQNMNCVERVMYYADELPAEKIKRNTSDPAISQGDPKWPSAGKVVFKDVKMRYREGLPMVLKGASFEVKAGEKVGVVGRTGAGKSSLLQILLRIVEIEEGAVEIDGVDIRDVELETLRRNIAVIPQDVKLFQGTLRDNLDPLKTMTDADLIAALRLASLVSSDTSHTTTEALPIAGTSQIPSSEKISVDKFTLETEVESEGSNFSAGEGQLIALSRALAKGSKIVLLDEATSSVDVETDSRIQSILASSSSTLLTIAHRLNTVAFYDRILVVDKGLICEFDEPLALFDRGPWNEEKPGGSLFRNLCDEAGLTRDDIVKIRNRLRS
ncbi:hypothetical protein FRC02_007501 [Tulasnella sp. 418]|nr:hypothetical protein FRC02_007501 [Tulasnella sp. 418]